MKERFENQRIVRGHPDYKIYSDGRLYSYKTMKFLKPIKQRSGYFKYDLDLKQFYIHSLVLTHFGGIKPEGYECDHINRDKGDNDISNLRYVTHADNLRHRNYFDQKGEKNPNSKLTSQIVLSIRNDYNKLGYRELATKYNLRFSHVYNIIKRITWKHI